MRKFNRKFIRRTIYPGWLYFLGKKLTPLSKKYGMNRGTPVDRYYIGKFLSEHKNDIRGVCLEIRDNRYGQEYENRIKKLDVLDIDTDNNNANLHDDLRSLNKIPENTYDCIILTQVLQYIDDTASAIKECRRILKPGGAMLITVPIMSRLDPKMPEYWRFTPEGLAYIINPIFGKEKVNVRVYGSVLTGLGFWVGQSAEEFSIKELDYFDPMFPILVAARAIK